MLKHVKGSLVNKKQWDGIIMAENPPNEHTALLTYLNSVTLQLRKQ